MKHIFQQKYTVFILSALIITGALSFNSAYASNTTEPTKTATENNTALSPQTPQIASNNKINNQKANSANEKRELSSFFIIGIGINFVMLLVFIYWAVGQWRQHKD